MMKKLKYLALYSLAFSAPSFAECPDVPLRCNDGTMTELNTKFQFSKLGCVPCMSGCGNGLDVAERFCEGHGGIDVGHLQTKLTQLGVKNIGDAINDVKKHLSKK